MPIFDYECEHCNAIYEIIKIRSDQKPICPKCGADDYQIKKFSFPARLICPQDDYPKDDNDLINYRGNGEYNKGYKRGMYK